MQHNKLNVDEQMHVEMIQWANQGDQVDQQLDGWTTYRIKLKTYGPEQEWRGTAGRNTLSLKSCSTNLGMISKVQNCTKWQ